MDEQNQQQTLPPQQPTIPPQNVNPMPPPQQSLYGKRSWLKWALIIVFVVLLTSITTYFVLTFQSQKAPPPQIVQTTPTSTTIPSPTPDLYTEGTRSATANWKTYTNNTNHYAIKYPNTWTIEESMDIVTFFPSRIPNEIFKQEQQENPLTHEPSISIFIVSTPYAQSPAVTVDQKFFIIKPTPIDVGGQKGFYYEEMCAPGCGISFDLPYESGNKTLRISLWSLGENIDILNKKYNLKLQDADEVTFNQILSTFKFTQ